MRHFPSIIAAACLFIPALAMRADPAPIDAARSLWKTGRYAEAIEAYRALASQADASLKPRIALGLADCLKSTGKIDEAVATLKPLAALPEPDPAIAARLAALEFERGNWDAAEAHIQAALARDADHLAARFEQARLADARGDIEPERWRWFIDTFNLKKAEWGQDPEALLTVARAAERYYWMNARGDELAEGLNDVLNELYEPALALDPECWQAAYHQGHLFLRGHRAVPARKELNRALLINPSAAEVIVGLGRLDLQDYKLADGRRRAEEALEINPACDSALILLADLNISDERFDEALSAARKAVEINPRNIEALARLAASQRLLVDPAGAAATELAARAINPRPTAFYAAVGERLADRRKYHDAERADLEALAVAADPERIFVATELGMLYMQIGREAEARALFEEVIAAHPFQDNVRVVNMLKVLDHLVPYEAIETPHYRVMVLPEQDALLGRYMADFLESSHAELTRRFGYEPPDRTQIEILKNHQWFSGRTVGLPFVPTVGACTGKVVALASPRATQKPFNWSRVMVHEVTHVITLRQTEFNIPHWFTEALAVESENNPRPQPWNRMLLERVPARDLLNLDNINLGFIRPEKPEDRQMAYCQAQLYAQYMLERFGEDAIPKMLDAYRRGLTTDRALASSFGVDKADFEKGYLDYLDKVFKTLGARVENEEAVSFSKLASEVASKPDDPALNARMAYEHFARRDLKAARPFADKALELQPNQPLASYVKARLMLAIGDEPAALEILRPALDPAEPNERVVDLLAELEMKDGNLDEAALLYEQARQRDPYHSKWIAGLARVYLRQKDRPKLLEALALLAANDADDLDVRRQLAKEYLALSDFDKAVRWATECLYIQVYDPVDHVRLGDARAGQNQWAEAAKEYEVALSLEPKDPAPIREKLETARRQLGQPAQAEAGAADVPR